jgi:hypothetical protein
LDLPALRKSCDATPCLRGALHLASCYAPDGAEIEEHGSTIIAACDQCGQLILYDDMGDLLTEIDYQSG